MSTSGTILSAYGDVYGGTRHMIVCRSTGEPQDNVFRIDSIPNVGASTAHIEVYGVGAAEGTIIEVFDNVTWASLVGYESPPCSVFVMYSLGVGVNDPFTVVFSWSLEPF
jgi:hypothetical protein